MCGIFVHICGCNQFKDDDIINEKQCNVTYNSAVLKHRGPDYSGRFNHLNVHMAHERLQLVGSNGSQPILDTNLGIVLVVNGEIYNYKELYQNLNTTIDTLNSPYFKPVSNSDCAVLIYLYWFYGKNFLRKVKINGMYSFVLYDMNKHIIVVGRDHVGIIPLYYGFSSSCMVFASEMKVLQFCAVTKSDNIFVFPTGTYIAFSSLENCKIICSDGKTQSSRLPSKFKKFYDVKTLIPLNHGNLDSVLGDIRKKLIKSVKTHLMINKNNKFGLLLSGGVDSSIIAAITTSLWDNLYAYRNSDKYERLDSFCIGLDTRDTSTHADGPNTTPDLDNARIAGNFLGTNHHTYTFTIEEGLASIEDVIWHIETYDVTTVRASIPMFLLAKKIKALGIKMVLSGEGADEIFGGYSYFKFAPNVKEFYSELVRKVDALHLYDCLRANKSMMAFGVEVRVPFLDIDFIDYAMTINPTFKYSALTSAHQVEKSQYQLEKKILRDAFIGFLPEEILNRPKEQFSDGVGNRWIEALKNHTSNCININTGKNMTELEYYKQVFDSKFKVGKNTVSSEKSIACSTEIATKWLALKNKQHDPSGHITSVDS